MGPAGGIERRKRPLWSVFLLTLGTFSLYFFVYLGVTWAELKRERRDPGMNPVGHVLAQLVPFYGYFRFHAHMRTVDELLEETGATERVDPLRSTIAYIIIGVFSLVAGLEQTPDWLIFPSMALYGALAVWHQRGLNAYYDRASGGTAVARVHWGEWTIIVLGMVLLLFAVLGTFFVPPEEALP